MPEKIQFFVLDAKYKINNEKAEVYLFCKTLKEDHIILVDDSFEPYFYVIPKKVHSTNEISEKHGFSDDAQKSSISDKLEKIKVEVKEGIAQVTKTEKVKRIYLEKEVDAIKVFTKLPRDVPIIRDVIKEWEMIESVNEYDIQFVRRYLIDKNITPMTLMEADVEPLIRKARVPVFSSLSIRQVGDETLVTPKIIAFDIETYNPHGKAINFEKNPIIMLSMYGKNFRKVITWKRFKTKEDYIEFVDSESDLIQKFKDLVEHSEPDILVGYYSDGFDLPYILKRAEKYKIKLDIGLDHSELEVSTKKESAKGKISGIVHIDALRVILKMFSQTLETDYYDLSSVAQEMINEKKIDVDLNELAGVWDKNPEELEKYCAYNLHDSKLAFGLAEKIMPNLIEMVKIVGLPMFEISRMGFSQLVEWYLIKQAHSYNEICPNKPHYGEIKDRMLKSYKGAFVFEPKPGLYKDVLIFDFRSLYPSIISSHNISPGSLNCKCCEGKAEKAPLEKTDIWFCKKKKGFLPAMIEDLVERRMRIKEIIKRDKKNILLDARQNNLKVLANAFYGYYGFFNARWYCLECAQSITAWGRYYIHKVIDSAEKEGFSVRYSDTDSIFISLGKKTKTEAKNFAESINMKLPGIMELEYEGYYPAAIFVSLKSNDTGAKKKYALIDEENKIHIKGFETVRRNWSEIAKEVQEKVLTIVLKDDDSEKALKYVGGVVNDLFDKKIPVEKVIIHTQLQKDVASYAAVGPHVVIAKRLKEKGYDVVPGMIIEYVVTEGKGKIGDRVKLPEEIKENNYDSDYYINNQVLPSVERIFEVLGYKKEDFVLKKGQSKLGSFMG
jgi:DNA polymerase elongation subunit (family B)